MQAGFYFLEPKYLRKSCLGEWDSRLLGQRCRLPLRSLHGGTFPGSMKTLRAREDILLIRNFQLSEEFRAVCPGALLRISIQD